MNVQCSTLYISRRMQWHIQNFQKGDGRLRCLGPTPVTPLAEPVVRFYGAEQFCLSDRRRCLQFCPVLPWRPQGPQKGEGRRQVCPHPRICCWTYVIGAFRPSSRQYPSNDDRLDDTREDCQNCSVLYSVGLLQLLCTVIRTHV